MSRIVLAAGLLLAFLLGGWEWTLPWLVVALALRWNTTADLVAALAPGLVWLALYAWSGDRRLYFCYSMHYAAQGLCLGGRLGIGLAALFVGIRVLQGASLRVLVVEVMVTVAILAFGATLRQGRKATRARRTGISILASLLALAGLAL